MYQAYVQALERLIRLLEERGRYRTAIAYARRLLQREPLREPIYRRLMHLHTLCGDRAGAIAVYKACAARLQRELGAGPGTATRNVYRRLLSAGTTTQGADSLPITATSFVGREEDLATIARRLSEPACRLLTIFGPGGVGKTRLVLQAARRAVAAAPLRFLHGAHFVPLAAVPRPDMLVPAIASTLDFRFYGRESPREQLLSYL